MQAVTAADASAVNDALDDVARGVAELQQRLTDATFFLPPFDVRQCQQHIHDLEHSVASTREQLAPKKKFAFKSRRKTTEAKGKPTGGCLQPWVALLYLIVVS